MSSEILGYRKDGTEIRTPEPGMFYSAALISCAHCGKCISGCGGPAIGASCVECWLRGGKAP